MSGAMPDAIRVLVLGTGQMGAGIARLVLEKQGMALAGAFARRAERAGMDLGQAIGLDRDLGIAIGNDLEAAISQCRPHIALQATCSTVEDAFGEISTLLAQGIPVISIAEQMAWPAAASAELAGQLQALAIDHQAAVLGTGINPGFVMDLLVVALSGVCADVQSIAVTRTNDLSPYGPSVLASQGVGLSPAAFQAGLDSGTVVGHFGFAESIHLVAATLGWDVDHIEETRTPILSSVVRETPFVRVEPGQVAGCHHSAVAYRDGIPVITLDHPQQVHPGAEGLATGDRIEITGTPNISLSGSPEIPGGTGTVALAVNMIPRLLNAAPGLYSMAELPVPGAILGDARRMIAGGP